MSYRVCPECGARLSEGTQRCDLCGTPLESTDTNIAAGSSPNKPPLKTDAKSTPLDIPEPQSSDSRRIYCNQCGWKNPPDARFCSQCGSKLQTVAAALPQTKPASLAVTQKEPAEKSTSVDQTKDAGLFRYVGAIIGLAILVVVALYMITVVSKQDAAKNAEAASAVKAPAEVRSAAAIEEYEAIPVADRYAPKVDSLRTAIAAAERTERRQLQRELVDFFLQIGRIDRAAIEQQRVAAQYDSLTDWRRAGDLLHDWMETVSDARKTDVALLAIDAYERVLEREPNNLDVRADLGWVYQYDPQNPMEAIRQTNQVLEEDPDHLAANYNRAVFLLRINRLSDALEQFEKVKDLADADSPYYRQAVAWIETVRRQQQFQQDS